MMKMQTASDERLLALARSDGEAFGAFYDRHHLSLLAAVRVRVGSVEVALDLTAEIFAAALQSRARFTDRGPGSGRAWLYGIARNKLVDLYRAGQAENAAREQLRMQPLAVSDSELERLEERLGTESSVVMDALAELPEHERDAVRARVLDDRDYSGLADTFCVSESVVRKRVSRGLGRLRATLEAHP